MLRARFTTISTISPKERATCFPWWSLPFEKILGHFTTAAVKSNDECNFPDDLLQCRDISVPLDVSKSDGLPGEDFFDENCSPLITKGECFRNLLQKCPDLGAYVLDTVETLNVGLEFVHSVCDGDSELRKSYLENLGCYNTVYPQMLECENTTMGFIDGFYKSLSDSEETIDYDCLLYPVVFPCVVQKTATVCGEEATDPLSGILDGIYRNIIKPFCHDDEKLAEWEARFLLFIAEQTLNLQEN